MAVRDFQDTVERIPQIVYCSELAGAIVYLNDRFAAYTGLSTTEALGWGWRPALDSATVDDMIESWRRSVRGSEAFESVHRLRRRADGMFRWHLSRGVAMRDASGAVVGWVGTNTDIHDIYEARQVQALERVVMSPAFENVLGRLSGTYREILAYQKDNVVARFPDGEPVSEAPALQLVELDILRLVAQGYSNREIARTLNYSVGAIKGHIREILDKLEAVDRTAAAVRAVRFGLI